MPLGPWLTTADEVEDLSAFQVQCEINGRRMQDASSAQMAFSFAQVIAELSRGMTLRAGDVVLTGTGRPPERYPDDEQAVGWRDIDSVADEVVALGRRALPLVSDVSDADAVDVLAEQVISEFGRVDIVVNNAGASWGAPIAEHPLEAWNKVISVNLTGVFLVSQAAGRAMIERGGGGKIVNVSSTAAFGALAPELMDAVAYTASKGGVLSLTRDFAVKWARQQT